MMQLAPVARSIRSIVALLSPPVLCTFTGKCGQSWAPRYLRVAGARKTSQTHEMVNMCAMAGCVVLMMGFSLMD
jgi:hypothetical protein